MTAALDLIGSFMIKAAIVAIILGVSVQLNDMMIEKSQGSITERNLNTTIAVFENDLRNLGLNAAKPYIQISDTSTIQFLSDMDNNGAVEIIKYTLQVMPEYATTNPKLYTFVRTINGGSPLAVSQYVLSARFEYRDSSGTLTSSPSQARSIKASLISQSPVIVRGKSITAKRSISISPFMLQQ